MQKRTIQVIAAAAVIFVMILLVALIINVVQYAGLKRRARELDALYAQAAALSAALDDDISLYNSDEFIERYAREYLYMIGSGEQAFTSKDK